MPLDGHSYLVAQGWSGKGTGLRQGAISRPLAIPQKRTLAGLGKDRDDAFPFWDHVFTIAAKTIQIKVHKDEDESGNSDVGDAPTPKPSLIRTSTGLISNKRPNVGTLASSGVSTPSEDAHIQSNRTSLIAQAKREAARKGLYSRFFRGPVIAPDAEAENIASTSTSPPSVTAAQSIASPAAVDASDVSPSLKTKKKKAKGKDRAEQDDRVERRKRKRHAEEGVKETSLEEECAKKEKRREKKQRKRDEGKDGTSADGSPGKRKHDRDVEESDRSRKKERKKREREHTGHVSSLTDAALADDQDGKVRLKKKRRKAEPENDAAGEKAEKGMRDTVPAPSETGSGPQTTMKVKDKPKKKKRSRDS